MLLPLPALAQRALDEALRLLAAGRMPEAAAAVRRAREAAPSHPAVPAAVADALSRRGFAKEALQQRFLACHLAPEDPDLRRALADALPGADLTGASPAIQAALERLLYAPDISPGDVGPAVLAWLRALPAFARLSLPATQAEALAEPSVQALLALPLWQALLARCLQTEPAVEAMLASLRRLALHRLGQPGPAGLLADSLEPLAALALQADLGAQAWLETPEESAAVAELGRRLAASPPASLDATVLVLASYRPLPSWDLPCPAGPPRLREAWERLLEAPRERARLGAALPALTPVTGDVSEAVRAQYEANPYPRWLGTNLPRPRPLPAVLSALFPWVEPRELPSARPLSILVAGCGTGEQAVRTARRFADCTVLAIDLSRASLGHAASQAARLGIDNLRFAQADLLALGGLAERFDIIESVGVLHHLGDPAAGWRVLRGLLKPGGLMRIGLYSRMARRPLAEVRRLVGADQPGALDAVRLRAARALLLQRAAEPAVAYVLRFLDAYDLDGLRDLLFHVQERDFALPEIQRLLAGLKLDFLGFEILERATLQAFRARFPKPASERSLEAWHRFETAEPATFAAMYRFWCRAA